MNLSHLSFLFAILVLASCNNKNIPGAPDQDSLIINTSEKQVNLCNTKYLHLLDIVERMRVLMEEEKEQVEKFKPNLLSDNMTPQKCESAFHSMEESQNARISLINTIHNQTSGLLNNNKTIDDYLAFLLKERFDYLNAREDFIKVTTLKSYSMSAENMFPTSKPFFDYLMNDDYYIKYRNFNELVRMHAVSRFELLNLLIKESFNSCTISELTTETISLLRSSIQLHSMLTGERQDLGHPDEAGGPYAILEPLILGSNKHINALQLLLTYPKIREVTNKVAPQNFRTHIVSELFNKITSTVELNEEFNPEGLHHFNELRKNLDLSVYQAQLVSKKTIYSI